MFGLDDKIASFSDGTTLAVVVAVSILLGLRHASDPDHLAAVTTLIASGKERVGRRAARLGLSWGLGHATSLFAFGVPVVPDVRLIARPSSSGGIGDSAAVDSISSFSVGSLRSPSAASVPAWCCGPRS